MGGVGMVICVVGMIGYGVLVWVAMIFDEWNDGLG